MEVLFDNNSGEKYTLEIDVENIDLGDGVILEVNQKACLAFAKLFSDLANEEDVTHLHLGYDQDEPQGPGLKIVRI